MTIIGKKIKDSYSERVSLRTLPMASNREALKEAAVKMTWGKLVAPGTTFVNLVPGPTLDTPCKASDHHSYFGIPSLLTLPALFTKNPIFSCNVSLFTKSATLKSIANDVSQNPKLDTLALLATSQAKTGEDWAKTRFAFGDKNKCWNIKEQRKTEKTESLGALFWAEEAIVCGLERVS